MTAKRGIFTFVEYDYETLIKMLLFTTYHRCKVADEDEESTFCLPHGIEHATSTKKRVS